MKRLLIINPEFTLPVNGGARIRTWRFVEALRDEYELSLVHPYRDASQLDHVADARRWFAHIWSVPALMTPSDGRDTPFARLRRIAGDVPWELECSHNPVFEEAVKAITSAHTFDVVLARYIYQARYAFAIPRSRRGRLVVDLDDVEPRKIEAAQRLASNESAYTRWRMRRNLAQFNAYHRRFLPAADLCIVCSNRDRGHLLAHRWSQRVAVVPNAIDLRQWPTIDRAAADPSTLLFCGTLNYEPNVDGLLWFIRTVWGSLKAAHPAVKLAVVGRAPTAEIRALERDPSITIHGDVDDVRPFYASASALIVPIRIGSGTRIKILEAAAAGRPVVSTTIGAEGLLVDRGRHVLIEDEPERFAAACHDVLCNQALAERLIRENRALVEREYDGAAVTRQIRSLFADNQTAASASSAPCAAS